ncbi:MAG: hypothetical protein ACREJM_08010, partial [Candidatus Saccharimonadales bacterium]
VMPRGLPNLRWGGHRGVDAAVVFGTIAVVWCLWLATGSNEAGFRRQPPLGALPGGPITPAATVRVGRSDQRWKEAERRNGLRALPIQISHGRCNHIDFGSLTPGQCAHRQVILRNGDSSTWRVAKIVKSCECITIVDLSGTDVAPGDAVRATVQLDLSDQPRFSGGICAEINAVDGVGRNLFCLEVNAQVNAADAGKQGVAP